VAHSLLKAQIFKHQDKYLKPPQMHLFKIFTNPQLTHQSKPITFLVALDQSPNLLYVEN
jgi:hypothetical protein